MHSDVLARAERRADRQAVRDLAPVIDEYGTPTVLLERFEPGPMVVPSDEALLAQAAFITEIARDARLARECDGWDALARARQARDRRHRLERLPRTRPADAETLARRATSGALNPPTRRNFDGAGYLAGLRTKTSGRRTTSAPVIRRTTTGYPPCPGIGCKGECGPPLTYA